jgi:tight adherence protein B
VSAGLAALLAGLGGAALALAFAELLAAAPAVRNYVESAAGALLRSGRDGSAPTVAERRRLGIVAGLGLSLITLLIAGPWLAAPVAGFGPWLADQALSRGATRYRQRLEEAVPVIARGLAAALASGGTVRRALRDLAPTLEGPAAVELGRVCADLDLGVAPRDALRALAERSRSDEVAELVGAVVSQERAGGDLVGLLNQVGDAAETRRRVRAEARSATAQARMTGGMVAVMPLAAGLLVELAQPGFIGGLLRDPLAAVLVACAVAIQIAAWVAIRRLGRVSP